MPEPYTTPFNVWQRLGRVKRHQKTDVNLETGDTLQLETHVIEDKVTLRDGDGNEISSEDYELDPDFSELIYTGETGIENGSLRYMTAPYSNDRAERGVEQAESHINNQLDTTFGGLKRRVEEVYQTDGGRATTVTVQEQPVRDVETVWVNQNPADDSPAKWKELEEDRDWIQMGNIGFKLTSEVGSIANTRGYTVYDKENPGLSTSPAQVKVTYTYGFEDVPADIENLAEILLSTDTFIDTVFGAGVDGRDSFDPQTMHAYEAKVQNIMSEWDREFYNNFSTLIRPGDEEDVE